MSRTTITAEGNHSHSLVEAIMRKREYLRASSLTHLGWCRWLIISSLLIYLSDFDVREEVVFVLRIYVSLVILIIWWFIYPRVKIVGVVVWFYIRGYNLGIMLWFRRYCCLFKRKDCDLLYRDSTERRHVVDVEVLLRRRQQKTCGAHKVFTWCGYNNVATITEEGGLILCKVLIICNLSNLMNYLIYEHGSCT